MSSIRNDGLVLDAARKLNEDTPKRSALVQSMGKYIADVASIEFLCAVDTHTCTKKSTNTAFHVIAREDGVPDSDQQLFDGEEQRRRCVKIQSSLKDFIEALGVISEMLDQRNGAYDTIDMRETWGPNLHEDFPIFGFFNCTRITDFFDMCDGSVSSSRNGTTGSPHSMPASRIYAGGICFDMERLMKSMATEFINQLDDSIRHCFDLYSPHTTYSSYTQDLHVKQQLSDLISAHVSMAWKTRHLDCQHGYDRQSLDADHLLALCTEQITPEACIEARRRRDNDAVRLGKLCELVRFSSTVDWERLRLLVESHKNRIIEVLKAPPRLFKSHNVLSKNFQWDSLRQILEVNTIDDLLTWHILKWARDVFDSPATSDALIEALECVIATMQSQRLVTSGFMPSLARVIGRPNGVPIPTWCQVETSSQHSRPDALASQLRELKQSGMLGSVHMSGTKHSGTLEMPADTEHRMRLISCVVELATNEKTASLFFSPGVFLVDHMHRVVETQRRTAEYANGFVQTLVDSSQLGRNYLTACRSVDNFRGTIMEQKIRKAGLRLSKFSGTEIKALALYHTSSLEVEMFSHARDAMIYKCPENFVSLVPRCIRVFLPAFLHMREISGIPPMRSSTVLEDTLRSIPRLMEWVNAGQAYGSELSLTLSEVKEGVDGGSELLTHIATARSGLVAKRRIGSKVMFVVNGHDLMRQLCGDEEVVNGVKWNYYLNGSLNGSHGGKGTKRANIAIGHNVS